MTAADSSSAGANKPTSSSGLRKSSNKRRLTPYLHHAPQMGLPRLPLDFHWCWLKHLGSFGQHTLGCIERVVGKAHWMLQDSIRLFTREALICLYTAAWGNLQTIVDWPHTYIMLSASTLDFNQERFKTQSVHPHIQCYGASSWWRERYSNISWQTQHLEHAQCIAIVSGVLRWVHSLFVHKAAAMTYLSLQNPKLEDKLAVVLQQSHHQA